MPPKFGFDPEILQKGLSNVDVQDYYNSWLDITKQFNSLSVNPVKDKLLRKRLEEYFQFEVELAKVSLCYMVLAGNNREKYFLNYVLNSYM